MSTVTTLFIERKHAQPHIQSQLTSLHTITDQTPMLWITWRVHRTPLAIENTPVTVSSSSSLNLVASGKFAPKHRQICSFLLEKLIRGFWPASPQDIYRWQICLGIPGERRGGRLVEMPHQEDPDCADKKHRCHDDKADPVNHPGNQEPLFILLNYGKIPSQAF